MSLGEHSNVTFSAKTETCDSEAQFLSSFSDRHTKVNDQSSNVAMALDRPTPPDALKGQENRPCDGCCTKGHPLFSLTSCLPAKRHAKESEQLTEEIKRLLMDPEWAAEASTAPGELTNKAHCCAITARVCFVQPLEAGGELTQTRCNAA